MELWPPVRWVKPGFVLTGFMPNLLLMPIPRKLRTRADSTCWFVTPQAYSLVRLSSHVWITDVRKRLSQSISGDNDQHTAWIPISQQFCFQVFLTHTMCSLPKPSIRQSSSEAALPAPLDSEVEHDFQTTSSGSAILSTLEYFHRQLPHGNLHPNSRINRRYEVL